MKMIMFAALAAAFVSCNPGASSSTTVSDSSAPAMQDVSYAYPIGYSSKFVMGDPKNAQTVLLIWKAFDAGNLASAKDYFADSVEVYLSDGTTMHSVRDSIIASMQAYRNTLKAVSSTVDALMAIKSTDKNEDWATVWGKEIDTYPDGKVDSVSLQETWRFNKDGKANLMFQFAAKYKP